jgi:hypothetical protein
MTAYGPDGGQVRICSLVRMTCVYAYDAVALTAALWSLSPGHKHRLRTQITCMA